MEAKDWLTIALGIAVALSNMLAWINRQQLTTTKSEVAAQLSAMELRLSDKIGGAYVGVKAHDDLEQRVTRLEQRAFYQSAHASAHA